MAAKTSLERIKQNADIAEESIVQLKKELTDLNSEYRIIRARQLQEENEKLTLAVEEAKKRLINLEVQNGIKQISLPSNKSIVTSTATTPATKTLEKHVTNEGPVSKETVPSKPKKEKPKQAKPVEEELPVDVGRLDLRVALIEEVGKHPDADSLYVLKINCGEEKPRTVCSGLVKFIPMEELQNRSVVLLCNLKPVKMRGVTSEAMVMCASSPDVIEVLAPPPNCAPGEPVHCQGYIRKPDAIMNPKKKIFETVAPDLQTNNSFEACYKGTPLEIQGKGRVISQTLKNCQVK